MRFHRAALRLIAAAALLSALAVAGCGGDQAAGDGSGAPEEAVTEFLTVWSASSEAASSSLDASEKERDRRVRDAWANLCQAIDPKLRGIRFSEDQPADAANCGAAVAVSVSYTGDTGEMTAPTAIKGEVGSVERDGEIAFVDVTMRYEGSDTGSAPAPPPEAKSRVLVVKRDGAWWVGTPQSFNPLTVKEGVPSVDDLREMHQAMSAVAQQSADG